jgi:hypothetical protein
MGFSALMAPAITPLPEAMRIHTGYFSFAAKCLRNLATFGATTAWQ